MEDQKVPKTRPSRTLHLFKKGAVVQQEIKKSFMPEVPFFVPVPACKPFKVHDDEFEIKNADHDSSPTLKLVSIEREDHVLPWHFVKNESWDIPALEKFYALTPLPDPPVRLNAWTTIIDLRRFVDTELATVIANNGNPTFRCSYDRLIQLMEIIIETTRKSDLYPGKETEPKNISPQ